MDRAGPGPEEDAGIKGDRRLAIVRQYIKKSLTHGLHRSAVQAVFFVGLAQSPRDFALNSLHLFEFMHAGVKSEKLVA
jgi:hypothetical protein